MNRVVYAVIQLGYKLTQASDVFYCDVINHWFNFGATVYDIYETPSFGMRISAPAIYG